MGYRSHVAIAVAFRTREQMEEVLAVYRMHPKVQEHNVMDQWKINTDMIDGDPPYMLFQGEDVKWYPNYEDVQAFEYIGVVCNEFADERGFGFAFRLVRIGEEDSDIVVDDDYARSGDHDLSYFIVENLGPVRRINCDL
jgi:hypothetical protein